MRQKPEAEIEPKPEAKVELQSDAKVEPKTEAESKTPSDLTPQIIERVHALYEQLGREDVRAVEDLEKAQWYQVSFWRRRIVSACRSKMPVAHLRVLAVAKASSRSLWKLKLTPPPY